IKAGTLIHQKRQLATHGWVLRHLTEGDFVLADGLEDRLPIEIGINHIAGHIVLGKCLPVYRAESNEHLAPPLITHTVGVMPPRRVCFLPTCNVKSPQNSVDSCLDIVK